MLPRDCCFWPSLANPGKSCQPTASTSQKKRKRKSEKMKNQMKIFIDAQRAVVVALINRYP
jgi:hypothetical protein